MFNAEPTNINDLPNEILKNEILPRLSTLDMMSALLVCHRFENLLPDHHELRKAAHNVAEVEVEKEELIVPFKKILICIKENDLPNLKKMAEVVNFKDFLKHGININRPYNQHSFLPLKYLDTLIACSKKEIQDCLYQNMLLPSLGDKPISTGMQLYYLVTFGRYAQFKQLLLDTFNYELFNHYDHAQSFKMAVYIGKEELVDLFINHPAITQFTVNDLNFAAVEGGHLAILKKTLARTNTLLPQDSSTYSFELLLSACASGQLKVLNYLLSLSTKDINRADYLKGTALNYAIRYNHPPIVKRLLEEKDINVNTVSHIGTTLENAIRHAALTDSFDIFDLLMAHPKIHLTFFNPLTDAVSYLSHHDYETHQPYSNKILLTIIKRLLDRGARVSRALDDIEERLKILDNYPKNSLFYSSEEVSYLNQAKVLLAQGIDAPAEINTSIYSNPVT